MKNKTSMFELLVNLLLVALALALVIQIMMKTTTLNYQNTIKAKAVIKLDSIVTILQNSQGNLDDFYVVQDSKIYFDKDNQNNSGNYYYYIEIKDNFPEYQLSVCDRGDNIVVSLNYEVAYEN